MESAFSNLRLDADDYCDEQGPPVYRSGADHAFASWVVGGVDRDEESKPASRCTPMDAWDGWDYHDVQVGLLGSLPPPQLVVTLTPHRIEGSEQLVCSLRQFLVVVSLVDGATSAPLPQWDAQLRASLVYADDGEPVPAQRGEAPLTGETDGLRPQNGECHFRLRAAALSYRHNRRAFAIRIDADQLAGGAAFACSHPIRAVARLPNETKTSVKPSVQSASAPTPSDANTSTAPASICPPAMPTIAVLPTDDDDDDDDDDCGDDDDNDCMFIDDCSLSAPAAHPPAPERGPSYTYTSHMDLVDELKVQGDMLQRVSAQQHFILSEIARMRSGGPPPDDVPPPTWRHVQHVRGATCV